MNIPMETTNDALIFNALQKLLSNIQVYTNDTW